MLLGNHLRLLTGLEIIHSNRSQRQTSTRCLRFRLKYTCHEIHKVTASKCASNLGATESHSEGSWSCSPTPLGHITAPRHSSWPSQLASINTWPLGDGQLIGDWLGVRGLPIVSTSGDENTPGLLTGGGWVGVGHIEGRVLWGRDLYTMLVLSLASWVIVSMLEL